MAPGAGEQQQQLDPEVEKLFNQFFQPGAGGQAQGLIPGFGVTKDEGNFYKVYFGERAGSDRFANKLVDSDENEASRIAAPSDREVGYDAAMTRIYHDGVQKKFVDLLLREGVIEKGNFSWDDVEGWWQKAVDGAAKALAFGKKKITPYDWIEMYAGVNGIGGNGSAAGGPSTTTDVSKSYSEIDDLDARAAAEDTYRSLMGRDPRGKEAGAIKAMLQAYAENHPTITRQTVHNDGEGHTSSTTHTSGGVSGQAAQKLVEDRVKARPGYGEFQAATTYFNALQEAIGATAEV